MPTSAASTSRPNEVQGPRGAALLGYRGHAQARASSADVAQQQWRRQTRESVRALRLGRKRGLHRPTLSDRAIRGSRVEVATREADAHAATIRGPDSGERRFLRRGSKCGRGKSGHCKGPEGSERMTEEKKARKKAEGIQLETNLIRLLDRKLEDLPDDDARQRVLDYVQRRLQRKVGKVEPTG